MKVSEIRPARAGNTGIRPVGPVNLYLRAVRPARSGNKNKYFYNNIFIYGPLGPLGERDITSFTANGPLGPVGKLYCNKAFMQLATQASEALLSKASGPLACLSKLTGR